MLKLVVALCFFAVAISLCCVCFSSGCGGSGCGGFRRRAVLLRLGNEIQRAASFCALVYSILVFSSSLANSGHNLLVGCFISFGSVCLSSWFICSLLMLMRVLRF